MQAFTEPMVGLPPEPVFRLSVEQYHSMLRSGILNRDSRVELLEGWLVPLVSKNPPHAVGTVSAMEAFRSLLPQGWHLRCEQPITLGDSEPEPDVAVVRGRAKDYGERHPGPEDLAVVVEVSDSTLERDRTTKKRIYARAGIPLYLLVDLRSRRVFAWRPDREQPEIYSDADDVPVTIGVETGRIPVADLLP